MPQLPDFWPAKHTSQSGRGWGARWALWEAVMKWSMVNPNPNCNPNPNAKAGCPLPSWSGAAAGWPVPPLQPLMADLPCLDGPARFCLLSGSVPPSQTWLLATAVCIPTEQAFEKKDTHTHTNTLFTLGTFCPAHTISLSPSLAHTSFSKLSHTQSLCLVSPITQF